MKIGRIVLIVILSILMLAGCSTPQTPSETTAPVNGQVETYQYVENGNESYISLNLQSNSQSTENSPMMGYQQEPYVSFASVKEMKSKIKTGVFTNYELQNISRFKKNPSGQILTCSVETLYEVTTLGDYEVTDLWWKGESYSYRIEKGEEYGWIMVMPKSSVQALLDENFHNVRYVTENVKTEDVVGDISTAFGTAYYYQFTSPGKKVHYVVGKGDTTYYIIESHDGHSANSRPYNVIIYGLSNTQSFAMYLYGSPSIDLSVGQLMEFGIRKYVETEVS